MYDVRCQGLLSDISSKVKKFPQLVSNNYNFCQEIGKRIHNEGYPGLISQSARCSGNNINIFKKKILSNQTLNCLLTYRLDIRNEQLDVINEKNTTIRKLKKQMFNFEH